jgi:hypothetical protein
VTCAAITALLSPPRSSAPVPSAPVRRGSRAPSWPEQFPCQPEQACNRRITTRCNRAIAGPRRSATRFVSRRAGLAARRRPCTTGEKWTQPEKLPSRNRARRNTSSSMSSVSLSLLCSAATTERFVYQETSCRPASASCAGLRRRRTLPPRPPVVRPAASPRLAATRPAALFHRAQPSVARSDAPTRRPPVVLFRPFCARKRRSSAATRSRSS